MDRPPDGATPNEVVRWVYDRWPGLGLLWWLTPNPAFGDRTPLEHVEQGGAEDIIQMVYQIESGVPS